MCHYEFDFREAEELEVIPQADGAVDFEGKYWVPVGKIARHHNGHVVFKVVARIEMQARM